MPAYHTDSADSDGYTEIGSAPHTHDDSRACQYGFIFTGLSIFMLMIFLLSGSSLNSEPNTPVMSFVQKVKNTEPSDSIIASSVTSFEQRTPCKCQLDFLKQCVMLS